MDVFDLDFELDFGEDGVVVLLEYVADFDIGEDGVVVLLGYVVADLLFDDVGAGAADGADLVFAPARNAEAPFCLALPPFGLAEDIVIDYYYYSYKYCALAS